MGRWIWDTPDCPWFTFNPSLPVETVSDPKSRFLLKRFKLLEQALAVEEQLHRASNAGLVQDPNQPVMQLHSRYNVYMWAEEECSLSLSLSLRFTDLDCLTDGHNHLVKECMAGDLNSLLLLRKGEFICTRISFFRFPP